MSAKNTYCIGIDIGTRCIYVSAAEGVDRSSSLKTITTLFNIEKRQRSIIPAIFYLRGQVFTCEPGYYKHLQNPQNSILFPKLFLGKQVAAVCSEYDYDTLGTVYNDEYKMTKFEFSNLDGTKKTISVTQAISYIILDVVKLIESSYPDLENTPNTVVIGIPSYWNAQQVSLFRRSLASTPIHDAVFLYDIEALSLAYGFYPNLSGNFSKKELTVMFVDVGYEHTTVFAVVFKNHNFMIQYANTSFSLSSRWIDQLLVQLVEEKLLAYNITHEAIEANKRLKAEIRSCVEKHKVIFSNESGDQMTFALSVSSTDQVDVVITQKEFQERCKSSGLLPELSRLCTACLDFMNGVDEAILEGSGTRLCFLADQVKILLPNPKYRRKGTLRSINNPEEDLSRGCCIMAICRSFPDKTSMIQLTLPIHYIVSERKKYIETSDLQKEEAPDEQFRNEQEQEQCEVQKMMNITIMRDEIYKTIIECQNLLSDDRLPIWYRKDMVEYSKLLASQLSMSGSQKLEFYDYSYLRSNAENLLRDIQFTLGNTPIIRIS